MANYFSFSVRVECDKKDVKNIVRFFERNMYDDEFVYEETNYGFVGDGICAWKKMLIKNTNKPTAPPINI